MNKTLVLKKLLTLVVTRLVPVALAIVGGFLLANYPEAHSALCTGL